MRKSGILMHISSLPGAYGVGSMGKCAYDLWTFWRRRARPTGRSCR